MINQLFSIISYIYIYINHWPSIFPFPIYGNPHIFQRGGSTTKQIHEDLRCQEIHLEVGQREAAAGKVMVFGDSLIAHG